MILSKKGQIFSSCEICKKDLPYHGNGKIPKICKGNECSRWWQMLRMYGVTRNEYEAVVERFGNRCAICGTADPGGMSKNGHWPIDHDHVPGIFRGLICNSCNAGIAMFKDDDDSLLSAIEYLHDFQKRPNVVRARIDVILQKLELGESHAT